MNLHFEVFEIRSDMQKLQKLLCSAFPEVDGDFEFSSNMLSWKYRKASEEGTCTIGSIGDEPVSFYGALARKYVFGKSVSTIGLVVDVLSAPQHQGKGVFTQTGIHAMESLKQTGISSVIGFPIRPEVMPGHLKIGWTVKFKLPVYLYPIGRNKAVGLFENIKKLVFLTSNFAVKVLKPQTQSDVEVLAAENFLNDGAVVSFYQGQNYDGFQVLVKDSEFLKWRLTRPNVSYVCFTLRDPDITAVAICRVMDIGGFRTLVVIDFDAKAQMYSKQLIGAVIDYAAKERVSLISFCTNKMNMKRLGLVRVGFIRSHLSFKVITREVNEYGLEFEDMKSRLTWLDSDTL